MIVTLADISGPAHPRDLLVLQLWADRMDTAASAVTARAGPATAQGLGAIFLWGTLAALSALAGPVPVLQLTALCFAIATAVGAVYCQATGQSFTSFRTVPPAYWLLGLCGLLGYHIVYFIAMKNAPPVEVSIIGYLWPLLIVLMSGLLPASVGGRPLRWWHVVGAILGFAGAALIPLSRGGLQFSGNATGYVAALGAALVWSSYSVASRLFREVPSGAVTGLCALSAVGAAIGHLAFETTVWPADVTTWAATLALGIGPVGLAFYLWDVGMKRGHLRLLGVLSYVTPLLSIFLLVVCGLGDGGPYIWLAVTLVTAGAVVASAEQISRI